MIEYIVLEYLFYFFFYSLSLTLKLFNRDSLLDNNSVNLYIVTY